MAKTTTNLALPYPDTTDSDNVPKDIKALAEALDILKLGSRSLKPTMGTVVSSGELTLSEAMQEVAGSKLEITPAVASNLHIFVTFAFRLHEKTATSIDFHGNVFLDGAEKGTDVWVKQPTQNTVAYGYKTEVLALTAALHTITLKALYEGGGTFTGGGPAAVVGRCRYSYMLAAS